MSPFEALKARLEAPQKGPRIRSQRDEMVQAFTDRLNTFRLADKLKPYSCKRVAILLSHIPTEDLHAFYQQCSQARHFSKLFHWALKPQHGKTTSQEGDSRPS